MFGPLEVTNSLAVGPKHLSSKQAFVFCFFRFSVCTLEQRLVKWKMPEVNRSTLASYHITERQ